MLRRVDRSSLIFGSGEEVTVVSNFTVWPSPENEGGMAGSAHLGGRG